MCAVDQQLFGRARLAGIEIVAEAVCFRFEHGEGFHIGLILRGVGTARREGYLHGISAILRGFFDRCASTQNDHVSQRHFFTTGLRCIEIGLDLFERLENFRQLLGIISRPIFMW